MVARPGGCAVIPIYLFLNVAVGASLAFASRSLIEPGRPWRSPALWSLVALQALVIVPTAAYLGYRYPAWSFLYWLDGEPSLGLAVAMAAALILTALAGFFAVYQLLARHQRTLGGCVIAGGLLGAGLVSWIFRSKLLVVGTRRAFVEGTAALRPLSESALGYLLAGAVVALLVAWVSSLWRLLLVSHAGSPKPAANGRHAGKRSPGTDEPAALAKRL